MTSPGIETKSKPIKPALAANGSAAAALRVAVLSWFGCGLSPKAPGTVGSLGALPIGWLILESGGPIALFIAALCVFAVGWLCASIHLRDQTAAKDPQWIVIDEVAGQWLTMLALAGPLNLISVALAFAAFRLFDIVKPWPVSWADHRVSGGLGVMLDDVLAGLYAAVVLFAGTALWAKLA